MVPNDTLILYIKLIFFSQSQNVIFIQLKLKLWNTIVLTHNNTTSTTISSRSDGRCHVNETSPVFKQYLHRRESEY